jgi:hypothetical protein
MKFPSFKQLLITVVISIAMALLGFLLFNLMGMDETPKRIVFTNAMALGAFLGSLITMLFVTTSSIATTASGTPKTIFIGNLAFKANTENLRELFGQYGYVHSVRIMTDRVTRRPRGFAFVEMDAKAADQAIKAINGSEFLGRQLRVNEGLEKKSYNDNEE